MRSTYRKILLFLFFAESYKPQTITKLCYAIKKILPKLKLIQEEYRELRNDIEIETAVVDEKGMLILDNEGRFRYTPEGMKKRNKSWIELMDKEVDNLPTHICPEDFELSDEQKEAFSSFIIPKLSVEEIQKSDQ